MSENKCYLCLRITAKEILILAHKVWASEPKIAHQIGLEASQYIKRGYKEKPYAFCRSKRSIIPSLFYLLGILHNSHKTARELAYTMFDNMTEPTVKNGIHFWLQNFPHIFPNFGFGKPYSNNHIYITFNGVTLRMINKVLM